MRLTNRWWMGIIVGVVLCLTLSLFIQTSGIASGQQHSPCAGNVSNPADGMTVISVQGMWFDEDGEAHKAPAKLVGVGSNGDIQWSIITLIIMM